MRRFILVIVNIILVLVSCSPRSDSHSVEKDTGIEAGSYDALDSLIMKLNLLSFAGEHDSVIAVCAPVFKDALDKGDSLAAVYSGLFMAQSFMFLENLDSVKCCTDKLLPLFDAQVPPNAHVMLSSILGSYTLRTSLDYSGALKYYMEALTWAKRSGESSNRISLLLNIVNIFYVQKSPKGLEYAEEAYNLAMNDPESGPYIRSGACIVMAEMHLIQNNFDETMAYLRDAERYAEQDEAVFFYSSIYSLFAQLHAERQETELADAYYRKAMEYVSYADPGTVSQVYLLYGNFLSSMDRDAKAMEIYLDGLDISESSGNLEYRQDLLGKTALQAYKMKDYALSSGYFARYISHADSIASRRSVEFQDMILSLQKAENEKMIMEKELEQQKVKGLFVKLLFVMVIFIILSCFVFLQYRRQRKMYRELGRQYQEYVSRLERKTSMDSNKEDNNSYRELFDRIEELMTNEKIYRLKNLSREMLSERLDTNNNYISKAINTYSGMTFNRYVDTFRIKEAAIIISQSPDILFKQLADDLGYNSVTVFSKAFLRETGCSPSIYRKEVCGFAGKKTG